jgi:Secretion system C-terminal sorting domain
MKTSSKCIVVIAFILPMAVSAQIKQFSIGSLGGQIQQTGGDNIQFIHSIGDIAGTFVQGQAVSFSQGFPQCFNCDNCDVTNVVYRDDEVNFRLFPNPASSLLTLDGTIDNIYQYRIFNAQGKLMTVEELSGNQIDIQSLATGLYTISFLDKKGQWLATAKIVKQ